MLQALAHHWLCGLQTGGQWEICRFKQQKPCAHARQNTGLYSFVGISLSILSMPSLFTQIWRHHVCRPFTASFCLRTHIVSQIHYGDSHGNRCSSCLFHSPSAVYCLARFGITLCTHHWTYIFRIEQNHLQQLTVMLKMHRFVSLFVSRARCLSIDQSHHTIILLLLLFAVIVELECWLLFHFSITHARAPSILYNL